MTTYRVHFKGHVGLPPLTVECDDFDIDPERAAFYLDDHMVAYVAGSEFSHMVIVPKKCSC